MKLLLKIAYDGSAFHGFQVQKNGVSVQSTLQDAVEKLYGARYDVTGCSRTDSGVHALEFYCTVSTGEMTGRIPLQSVPEAMNCVLPDEVAVMGAYEVPDSFHVRHDALSKEYEYLIQNDRLRNPFTVGRVWLCKRHLDESVMNRAAAHFVGEHDFSAFMSAGSKIVDTVRNVSFCRVSREDSLVKVNISANGFLYNMVRIIVGTLVEVSDGKIGEDEIPAIIASKDRSKAGLTAPPEGLYLKKVSYKTEFGKNNT